MEADRSSSCLFFIGWLLRGSQTVATLCPLTRSHGDPAELLTLCCDSGTGFCPRTACTDRFLHLCPCADKMPRWAGPGKQVAYWMQQGDRPGRGIRPGWISPAEWNRNTHTERRWHARCEAFVTASVWNCSPIATFYQKESGGSVFFHNLLVFLTKSHERRVWIFTPLLVMR